MSVREISNTPSVLILPDGNRRWARVHGTDFATSYDRGARRIAEAAHHLGSLGMRESWFGVARPFNFERDIDEQRCILNACLRIHGYGQALGGMNVRIGGQLDLMPDDYAERFLAQQAQQDDAVVTANLLLGWDGLSDITKLLEHTRNNPDAPTDLASLIARDTVTQPIDLLIRTGMPLPTEGRATGASGGRVSGMVPWHSTDAELYFTDTLFPDFTASHLDTALADYAGRQHRNVLSV